MPSPARALLLLAAAFFLLAAVIVIYALGTQPGAGEADRALTEAPGGVQPDEQQIEHAPAPPFSLPSLRGPEYISLAEYRGHAVVLNFFASWCKPCELEAATLERAWQASRADGVIFIGVAVQDRAADARAFLQKHGITYPAAFDASNDVMLTYRVVGIPTTYFISPLGLITGGHAGIFVGDEGVARLRERIGHARARQ